MALKPPIEAYEKNGEWFGTLIRGNGGVVCFESDETHDFGKAIMELQSTETKRAAQREAMKRGVADARLEFSQSPYPVDASGDLIVNPVTQKIAAYRIDVKVVGRLV